MTKLSIFVDTSAWFAYVNALDPDHRRVRRFLDGYRGTLVTSSYIFDETVTLVLARLGHRRAVQVGRVLLDPAAAELVHVSPALEKGAWELFARRSDKSYSFTDCSSFCLMLERNLDAALTLDEHFAQEGFYVVPD